MAIGLARMLGFRYLENFNYPYISKSISEFWRRWHISLGTFFRDYLYIPLGGNRVSNKRWVLNVLIVWFLTGLWHGAAWNFILWGMYFGLILLAERFLLQNNILKVPVLNRVYTIFMFIIGWVIFRADSVAHIGEILSAMFGAHGAGDFVMLAEHEVVQIPYMIAIAAGIICSMPVSRYVKKYLEQSHGGDVIIDVASLAALTYCVFSLVVGSYNPFIYFIF
jgi:alginate O-acetyltransferase complex protein AlgI